MVYCSKCGKELDAEAKFCDRCGASLNPAPEPTPPEAPPSIAAASPVPGGVAGPPPFAPVPAAAPQWQSLPAAPAPAPQQPASNKGCITTILVVLAILALIAVLVIGGIVYVGYKIKQKATALIHEAAPSAESFSNPGHGKSSSGKSSDDASSLLGGLASLLSSVGGNENGDLVESISDTDPVDPCPDAPFPSQASARIPMQEGTVITTAWGIKYEDVETRMKLGAPTSRSIGQTNSTETFKDDNAHMANAVNSADTVCNADLASATTYVTTTGKHIPHLIHGLTRLRLSDKAFNDIKTSGKTEIRYLSFQSDGSRWKPSYDGGVLTRAEAQDVPYPLIVNDQRISLPAIHLTGTFRSVGKDPRPKKDRPAEGAAEAYVVDDPANPLVLLWRVKDPIYHEGKFRIEVVKIEYKTAQPVNLVEKQLTEQKRAVTYGIYFDFNKDIIKPESEPVLKQIVQTMADNPSWKLTVEGHTDNIGGDSYNLDLSKRRAAAVKQALVARYHISADRLSTDGFGASRPVDSNDTLEGRARNRRVELSRE